MEKLDSLNQVALFHKTFKAPILATPQIPAAERTSLRVSLIAEELKELEEGIKNNDIVEIADALCDIQYVLSGAVLEFGLGDKFVALFNEVQRSNMSKACSTLEEAEQTIKFYFDKDGTEAYIQEDGDKYLVYRRADNKILKSVNYSPANLEAILQ
ncbi:nucleoside triphosphate pyrophosphohydrolase family protein [Flectobacillus major]|jgi:predicted HAD superfamily Cof-like phosphohydrolase|uniref:nucleoside triphosphate pyrophosphohydrolase family protein n=1 Tax=Flectobacillus major TaxID=103 RepID=UPI000419C235|nr:nucleoside triphosphate pyrophosphohydrolase family protein [Flectobacillus major]